MGTCYGFYLAAGLDVPAEALKKLFSKEQPEVSHMEPRFDAKTGERIADEKVIDQHKDIGFFYGEYGPMDFVGELAETIAEDIGCQSYLTDYNEGDVITFCPKMEREDEGLDIDWGRISCSGGYKLQTIIDAAPEFERIKQRLRKLGLEPSEPVVKISWNIG